MRIRGYAPSDIDALFAMYKKQRFDYRFPDLCNPLFVSKLVVEDEDHTVVMAALARLTCEMYLLVDPGAGDPVSRYSNLRALQFAGEQDLYSRGLDDAHAWLPPRIAGRFGRRLEDMGWVRDDLWIPYCRRFEHPAD